MTHSMSEEEIYEEAKKRVKEKREFYTHLSVYVTVNILLVIIWWITIGPDGFPWFVFPLAGWGIGIVMHFLQVFVWGSRMDRAAIEKEADKIRRQQK
jgi:uncharacterized protein (DUF486 family)